MDLVIDASVVVKWFLEEHGSDRALLLRDDFVAGDVELHAPAILPFEVLNALRFSALVREEMALRALAVLDGYAIQHHPLAGELGRRTLHLAYTADTSIYDAAYVAVARELGTKLVTADQGLIDVAGSDAIHIDDYTPIPGT